jgi:hypothetical protein
MTATEKRGIAFHLFLVWLLVAGGRTMCMAADADPKAPQAPAGLRIGFFGYWSGETAAVVKAAGGANDRFVPAAMGSASALPFMKVGGAAAVGKRAAQSLEQGEVDALVICLWSSYPGRWEGHVGEQSTLSQLADLGKKNNPEFRILWHAFMMPSLDKPRTQGGKYVFNLPKTKEGLGNDRRQLEAEVDGVNKRHGRRVACIIPFADAALTLMDQIAAGKFPGLTDPGALFPDDDSWSPGRQLLALSAYCHYATLCGKSPVGLKVPFGEFQYGSKGKAPRSLGALTDEEDAILQRIAWETVSKYPYAGIAK